MADDKVKPTEIDTEKYPKTKATLAIMAAAVSSLVYIASVLGIDFKQVGQAKEQLVIAEIRFKEKKLDIELKKLEFEMYKSGISTCFLDPATQEKIDHSFELSHPKG